MADAFVPALKKILESRRFETVIVTLIVINAITLGLETSPAAMARAGTLLAFLDTAILAIFTAEVAAKLLVYRLGFFRDPWKIFDFLIVGIALVPASGNLSVLRALRILRALRLVSVVPSLRRVVSGLVSALPGIGSIMVLLLLVFYVFSVMATKLYGPAFPEWFGSVPASAYSLFQIMTLESWSMGIVRPVMEKFPYAWAFFVPFIVSTSFTVLNLFIGIIVSAMQEEHDRELAEEAERRDEETAMVLEELRQIRAELGRLSNRESDR